MRRQGGRHNASTMGIICYNLILMSDPLETAELLAFAKTVDSKSLSRAAAELGVPRATVSRRLARLEERLDARLLKRTTRSLVLTDAGEALYRHARIVLDAVAQAESSVRRNDKTVRGDLRVSVMPMMNDSFDEMVSTFAAKYPELRLQIHVASQLVDLKRDAYDVAIRASNELEPGLVVRVLARDPVIVVASPAYLATHGTPRTRRDLARHRCIMGLAQGDLPATQWPTSDGGKIHVDGSFFSNDIVLRCHAALRGLGLALMPLMLVRSFVESGALVQVLAGTMQSEGRMAIVYPEREFVPPQVRAFVDAVLAWAPKALGKGMPTADECDRRGPARRPRRG
ncbi:MAG: transcriptional regulator, LysR family [Myxococcales bacterium]|nr:transcriptional regulator, LysR family [Myxococcales bacterium]